MKINEAFAVLKQAGNEWVDDKAPTHGAALAYYTLFSIAPLLIIAIGIAGMFLDSESAKGRIFDQVYALVGAQGGKAIADVVQNANAQKTTSVVATVIGVATLLLGASTVFGQLQGSLNTVWGVEPKPGRGLKGVLKDRVLSFGLVLVIGFLLLVSLLLTAFVAAFGSWLGGILPGGEAVAQALNFVLSLAVITALFAMIFKMLPDVKIAWRDVWIGAVMTAVFFVIGKLVLGIYLGKGGVSSSFGAAGSLIVVVVWVYYSAQILIFGAEFTQVYANRFGSHVEPADNAVRVSDVASGTAARATGGKQPPAPRAASGNGSVQQPAADPEVEVLSRELAASRAALSLRTSALAERVNVAHRLRDSMKRSGAAWIVGGTVAGLLVVSRLPRSVEVKMPTKPKSKRERRLGLAMTAGSLALKALKPAIIAWGRRKFAGSRSR